MRINNIDFMKVFAIFLVICVHFAYQPEFGSNGSISNLIFENLLSNGVIIFMICTGYLIIDKDYSYKSIFKKIFHLLLLIFIYKMISYSLMGEKWSIQVVLGGVFDYNQNAEIGDYRTNYLWYIYRYMGILLMQPIFKLLYKDKKNYLIFTITMVIYTFIIVYGFRYGSDIFPFVNEGLPGKINPLAGSNMISLFLLGGLFKLYEENIINTLEKIKHSDVLLILIFIVSFVIGTIATYILIKYFNSNINPVTYHYNSPFGLMMGISFFCLFRYRLPKIENKVIINTSKNVLGFYFMHWPVCYVIKELVLTQTFFDNVGGNIIQSIIVFIICYLIIYVLNKIKYLRFLIKV